MDGSRGLKNSFTSLSTNTLAFRSCRSDDREYGSPEGRGSCRSDAPPPSEASHDGRDLDARTGDAPRARRGPRGGAYTRSIESRTHSSQVAAYRAARRPPAVLT